MDGVLDIGELTQFQVRLQYMARRRYRIPAEIAEDLAQAAFATFLEVRDRYPNKDEHPRILVGIFRNKCREHIDSSVRAARVLRALREAAVGGEAPAAVARTDGDSEKGLLDDFVRREDGRLILEALGELRPKAREMFRLIAEEGATRADLIRRYGLNKNTLDSRLHAFRAELRQVLARRGLDA